MDDPRNYRTDPGCLKDVIHENVARIRERIATAAALAGRDPGDISLVAVSKSVDSGTVKLSRDCGFSAYGENRVQELLAKQADGAYSNTPVHMIGTLQTNKVGKVVGKAALIQSVDSFRLAGMISKRAVSLGIVQDILLQVNIGRESTKGGVDPEFADELAAMISGLEGIKLRGLMAIPPAADVSSGNMKYFSEMYKLFVDIRAKKYDNVSMDILSMGMSGDFEAAIAEGSNMVRIGSAIFGPRDKKYICHEG